jgi:hypothetical protein
MSFSEFHDGRITGIRQVAEGRFEIDVILENGGRRVLVIDGVERLRCTNFREGNVVLDACTLTKTKVEPSVLRDMMDIKEGEMSEFVMRKIEEIERGGWYFFMYLRHTGVKF